MSVHDCLTWEIKSAVVQLAIVDFSLWKLGHVCAAQLFGPLMCHGKVGKEDIFKPTTGNESLHEISNDNGVRVVNFATSKNLTVKSTTSPYHNIYNLLGHLTGRTTTKLTIFS
jgi:hypothetical protein